MLNRLTNGEMVLSNSPIRGATHGSSGIRASTISQPIPMKSREFTVARSAINPAMTTIR